MSTRFDPPERGPLGPDVATAVTTPIVPPNSESAVSWGAIFAGAVAAAALSLILLILGVGLGLSSVSPWSFEGVSKETFGWTSVAWLTFTALAASGLGGYLAGRLRTKWTQIHGDETYFRDTAHGFVSWAVATLLTAGLLTSAIGGVLGAGAKVAGATAGAAVSTAGVAAAGVGTAAAGGQEGDLNYWVDSLFRNATTPGPDAAGAPPAPPAAGAAPGNSPMDPAAPPPPAASVGPRDARTAPPPPRPMPGNGPMGDRREVRAEVNRIIVNSLQGDGLDPADTQYLAGLIARETGMSQAEAQARVTDVQTRMRAALEKAKTTAKQAADDARKATAYAALWLFITLLIGAFFASLSATWGGRRRDL
ncbi:membrane protein [Stenotrophomonas maltophilia 5BA-I-2]|nr:membrane protein [Stenotrophomonas maltophilia 5BA-I-2]